MHRTVATLLAASLLASSADAKAASFPLHRPVSLGTMSVSGVRTNFFIATSLTETSQAAPVPAASGETETFDTLVAQATGKFKDKDYAGAVALFERAYAVQPEPAILFNIGRIYEEAQNAEGDLRRRSELERRLESSFHPYWGSIFRAGPEVSGFGDQVEEFACLYTTKASNLAHYSASHFFQSPRERMPHEL